MKIQITQCDCCGAESDPTNHKWDQQFSVFSLDFPRDGTNSSLWNMDVCPDCRHRLHDTIANLIAELRTEGRRKRIAAGKPPKGSQLP